MSAPRVVIIAGEASGDFLGANLIKALHRKTPDAVFTGVGGHLMQTAGCPTLFPMQHLSIMGLTEVIPHIPKILRLMHQVIQHVEDTQPDIVITIDAPGFNFRLAQELKYLKDKKKIHAQLIHYVAPSVWAWKKKRAARIARIYDHLLCLLPFEPPYFTPHGLAATFVGHPIIESGAAHGNGTAFRMRHSLRHDMPTLGLLPGSRRGEITRMLPIFLQTAANLAQRYPGLQVVLPTFPHLLPQTESIVRASPLKIVVTADQSEKYDLLNACDVALAASGTVSLELALAKIPAVIGYKISPITHMIVKRLIKAPYASLPSLLLEKPVFIEKLQNECTAGALEASLIPYFTQPEIVTAFKEDCSHVFAKLMPLTGEGPSERAANIVLQQLALHHH